MSLRLLTRLAACVVGLMAFPVQAMACTESTGTYFSYDKPAEREGYATLQVRIIDAPRGSRMEATLEPPLDRLSPDGRVTVTLSGDDCTAIGPIDGPVMVSGHLVREPSGRLHMRAMPSPVRPGILGRSTDYCRYIVDPADRECHGGDAKASR